MEHLIFYQSNVFTGRSEKTGQIMYDYLFLKHVEVPLDKQPNHSDASAMDDDDYVDGDLLCDDTTFYSEVSASSVIPCEGFSYIGLKGDFPR